jgi:hypothetical protein
MIVDHTDGLHMGVHDSASDKLESSPLEIIAERVGFR